MVLPHNSINILIAFENASPFLNREFKYDCCPGFKRTKRFDNQCVERERTWKLIPGLLSDHGHQEFAKLIVDPKMGAGHKIINDSAAKTTHTVIAPYSPKVLNKGDVKYDE